MTVIDIEAKIWKFSNTGMKMHCFDGGVALCNSNIRRFSSDAGIDYSEAQVNYNLCTRCETKFEAAIEAAEQVTEVEPAPEGYAPGQAVVVQHPGRQPFTGTVAHINTAPGYVAVKDDRYRAVSDHPTNFVSHVETDDAQDCVDAGPECTCPPSYAANDYHGDLCPTTTATEEEETMTSNPNAGTYRPNKPGSDTEPLVLQYMQICGVVHSDGRYAVIAGSSVIAKGELDGTEGPLMAYFTQVAQRWSALVDEVMAEEAAERAERIAAHHAEATVETAHKGASIDELVTLVASLGGRYHAVVGPRALSGDAPSYEVDFHAVLEVLRHAAAYGFHVDIKDRVEGNWYLALTDATGKVHGRYHRM